MQAPLPLESLDAIAALTQASPLPLWIGEAGFDPVVFDRLASLARPPLIQLNPALVGFTQGALLARSFASRTPTTLQCHATAVLQAACLHLAGCERGIAHAEFHRFHRHLHELMPAAMHRVRDGVVTLGTEPGLGIELPAHDPRLRLVARVT